MNLIVGCPLPTLAKAVWRIADALRGNSLLITDPLELFLAPAAERPGCKVVPLIGLNASQGLLELQLAAAGANPSRLSWVCLQDEGKCSGCWSPLAVAAELLKPAQGNTLTPLPASTAVELWASNAIRVRLLHDELKNPLLKQQLRLQGGDALDESAVQKIEHAIGVLQRLRAHPLGETAGQLGDRLRRQWDEAVALAGKDARTAARTLWQAAEEVLTRMEQGAGQWDQLRRN